MLWLLKIDFIDKVRSIKFSSEHYRTMQELLSVAALNVMRRLANQSRRSQKDQDGSGTDTDHFTYIENEELNNIN